MEQTQYLDEILSSCGASDWADTDLGSLLVRPIRPKEEEEWERLMATYHYLGYQRLVGESLKYVAELGGKWVALIGWGTAAFKCRPRDRWIGWEPEQQWQRLKFVANNQRYLILPSIRIKNLASKVLALNLKRLSADWQTVYGHPIVLAETFVDSSRFSGTCYRAAGWEALGQTRGYGRSGGQYFFHGQPKTVFVRPLLHKASRLLAEPFLGPELLGPDAIDLNQLNVDGSDGLLEVLAQVKDRRKRRGIRHQQVSILAVAVCAVLSGARNFKAIGEWAADLPPELLKRFNCRLSESKRKRVPPSEPTLRRTLQSVDPNELDQLLGTWLMNHQDSRGIAIDGKTLKGAVGVDGKPVHLLAALLHKEGVVIAQNQVDAKSNEITALKPLVEPLNIQGKVVTTDALHTQVETARYLKEEKSADYVMIVKGNQPTLLHDMQAIEEADFSPSLHHDGKGARPD